MRIDEKWIRAHLPVDCADEPLDVFSGYYLDGLTVMAEGERGRPDTVVKRNCVTGSWKTSVILWEKPIHQKSGDITGIMPKTEVGCISNTGIMITMPSKMRDFRALSASCGILSPAFRLTAGKRR